MVYRFTVKSLRNRKVSTVLSICAIAMSVVLLVGIEKVRTATKQSFERTVSGVDLIVGARSGSLNLLLYSVFRLGNATNNVEWSSFEKFSPTDPEMGKIIQWSVPISLGDSHRGFRVVGTNNDFFEYIKYSGGKSLEFTDGKPFSRVFEVVLGSEVAEILKYKLNDKITLSHGTGEVSFQEHTDKPFTIVGILKRTGTPIDRSLHVKLEAIEAIHLDWQSGAPPMEGQSISAEEALKKDLKPKEITAFFLGLKSRIAVFNVQRRINEYEKEPLTAILPGMSLQELWQILNVAETALLVIGVLVWISGLVSLVLVLLASLNERRREMALFRSVGASSGFVVKLLVSEALVLTLAGITVGYAFLTILLLVAQPLLEANLGLSLSLVGFSWVEMSYVGAMLAGALAISIVPAIWAYRRSLADGLIVRI